MTTKLLIIACAIFGTCRCGVSTRYGVPVNQAVSFSPPSTPVLAPAPEPVAEYTPSVFVPPPPPPPPEPTVVFAPPTPVSIFAPPGQVYVPPAPVFAPPPLEVYAPPVDAPPPVPSTQYGLPSV
ncbi:pollen-specific leucine-rich repeat extensin-like protein 4 [Cimex lectularius]|uniref:CPR type cuticle protein n=1 Tax=Cimex lectularius TaxID=79782 RepID=A0A8I6RMT0_CIMLE|nr:pollen-specific leucine-rich repeat extensin-like protein 4 [Cimex lectularius]